VITVSVNHYFSAGHRILGLNGPASKCANLHGHTFDVEWTFRQGTPFVEFTFVKRVLRGWVDETLDHGYIVAADDRVLLDFLAAHDLKHYTTASAPTTEAIAVEIAEATQRCLPACCLLSVRVGEGPHNSARWERDLLADESITKRFTRTVEGQRQT
jgi:6-pyruvoyltetrahydropterin/6-carboxytetrahydropterin synthase